MLELIVQFLNNITIIIITSNTTNTINNWERTFCTSQLEDEGQLE